MNRKKSTHHINRAGQTLVILLVFITVAIMVMVSATLLSSYALTAITRGEQSEIALGVAESGMEDALLRLLRDPSYTGDTLVLPEGTATTVVTGTTTKTLTTTATAGNFERRIIVTASYTGGILSVTSWFDAF